MQIVARELHLFASFWIKVTYSGDKDVSYLQAESTVDISAQISWHFSGENVFLPIYARDRMSLFNLCGESDQFIVRIRFA